MNRKDYQEVASALLSAAARLDGELEPGGAFESIDQADARRLLAVLAGGMADWFAEHNPYRFNPEAFLNACGLLEDVTAATPARTGRRTNEPIAPRGREDRRLRHPAPNWPRRTGAQPPSQGRRPR
jgi:hypothetical protein